MYLKYDLSIDDYINILKRRIFILLGVAATIFIIAFFTIIFLPSVYESSATILIESKKITGSKGNPWEPKQDNMTARFEALNTMLLTNEKMLKVAKKYNLFIPKNKKVLTSQDEAMIASNVRKQITTKLIKAETGSVYEEKQALAIQIGAQFGDPEVTYNVANDIVHAFVNETSNSSKKKAVNASKFFDKDAEQKRAILEKIEQELIAYKRSHAGMLPQNVPHQVGSLERLEADLRMSQKEQSLARSELSGLEVELASAKAGIGMSNKVKTTGYASYQDEADRLNAELSKLKTIYSDNHPAVKSLKRKIAAIEVLDVKQETNEESLQEKSIEVARVQAKIKAANSRIRALEREENQIRSRMNRAEAMVFQSAQTEGVLEGLQRKYEAAKGAYNAAKQNQDKAKLEKEIELQDQGERFVITEPPVLPTFPIKPNKKLLLVASLIAAVGFGFVLIILMELFDPRLRGQDAIAHTLKMQPMAFVPYIRNHSDVVARRYKVMNLFYWVILVVILCLTYTHFLVMPIDEMLMKVLEKLNAK